MGNASLVALAAAAEGEVRPLAVIVGLVGGVALLLFGLGYLTTALRGVAGDGLRVLIARLTGNRFKAVATGAAATAILQSSTVTTVLVVGFVGSGLMGLIPALGVILGSKVGTTITAQVVAFDIADWALGLVAVGFIAASLARSDRVTGWGGAVLGLGLVFLGIGAMGSSIAPLKDHPGVIEMMGGLSNPLLGVVLGTAFTAIVQSSSATTVVAIVVASQGLLPLAAGVAIVLGANIGTCVTAGLAALGKSRDAQRAAAGHILFAVVGAALWLLLLGPLVAMAVAVSPQYPQLEGPARLAAEVPRQLANAHTIFNLANVVLFIGLLGPTATLLGRLMPDRPVQQLPAATPRYLDPELMETPSLAVEAARREVGRLGDLVVGMLRSAPDAVLGGTRADLGRLEQDDDDVDQLYAHIVDYLAGLNRESLSESVSRRSIALLEASNALESIADLVETNLVSLGSRRLDSGIAMNPASRQLLGELFDEATRSVVDAAAAVAAGDSRAATEVAARRRPLNRRLDAARTQLAARLSTRLGRRSLAYAIESDLLEVVKRIEYLARRIIRPLLSSDEDDPDPADPGPDRTS